MVAAELERYPHRGDPGVHVTSGLDLVDETAVRRFYAGLPALWASIHLAGGFAMSPVAETSAVAFADQFQMNALSAFLCSAAAIRAIRGRAESGPGGAKGGRIVNVAARPGLEPRLGSGMVAYATAKAAVAAMTEALAQETADEEIWVNAVAPSILDTPANRAAMPDADHSGWVAPSAVADVIAFLASPENRGTRGAVIPVYGGA
jgi:NAD(P)-dependent dehydrogenase (short-subunit alcohol dehydrogenase family)